MNLNPLIHRLSNKLSNYFLHNKDEIFNLAEMLDDLPLLDKDKFFEENHKLRYVRFSPEKEESKNKIYEEVMENTKEDVILKMIAYWMVQAAKEGIDTVLINNIERKHGKGRQK